MGGRRWSEAEIEFVFRNRSIHTLDWLAEQLGRPREGLKHKFTELGVYKFPVRVLNRREKAAALPDDWKLCRGPCGEALPLKMFSPTKLGGKGHMSWCRQCSSKHAMKWNREHPERFKRNQRTYHLRKTYGLSRPQFDALLARQEGRCPICSEELGARIHVDHDHGTNQVRGLLHSKCNAGLGALGDSIETLQRAIAYLTP